MKVFVVDNYVIIMLYIFNINKEKGNCLSLIFDFQ